MNMSIKEQLVELMKEQEFSQRHVSRALGVSQSMLSQYLKNSYPGDVRRLEGNVMSFMARAREKKDLAPCALGFVETSISRKFFEVARICHLDGEIGVVCGNAGLGKTIAAKEYVAANPDCVLIEADLSTTARVLFQELHRRLGMDGRGGIHDLVSDVISKLSNSGRLIVVDEAENLPYRALELLRRVYDKAGVGILLCGMPRLISNLRGKKGEYAQLYSRVGIYVSLSPLQATDTEALVKASVKSGATETICKSYHEASGANTRVLCKLIKRSLRVAEINKRSLSPEIVRETAKMLVI